MGTAHPSTEAVTSRLQELCLPAEKPALCPSVLVASARKWLVPHDRVNREPLKPSLFLSWHPFVTYEEDGTGVVDDLLLRDAGCVGGVVVLPDVFSCLGNVVTCHEYLSERSDCYGMLLARGRFTLYHSISGLPTRMITGGATEPGTASAVQGFFASVQDPPLLTHLRALLAALGTDVTHIAGRCHLGSGRSGHVFTVRGDNAAPGAAPRALKVLVFTSDEPDEAESEHQTAVLKAEFSALSECVRRGAAVIAPVPHSLRVLSLAVDPTGRRL